MSITIDATLGITQTLTGAETIPVGTTAQRPATPIVGMKRFNSTLLALEVYNGITWISINTSH